MVAILRSSETIELSSTKRILSSELFDFEENSGLHVSQNCLPPLSGGSILLKKDLFVALFSLTTRSLFFETVHILRAATFDCKMF